MVSKALAALFALLMLPVVVLAWFQRDVLSTDGYVAVVSPLAGEPQVQTRLSDAIATEVTAQLNVPALVDNAAQEMPPKARAALDELAQPLQAAVNLYVADIAEKVVASDAFAAAWTEIHKVGHRAVMNQLSKQDAGEEITVELGPIVDAVKARLLADGFQLASRIPDSVEKEVVLVSSPLVEHGRRWYHVIKVVEIALPILALVLLGVALWLAKSRLQILFIAAMGTAIAMLVLTALTYLGHRVLAPKTGIAVYDAFADSLRSDIRWVMAIAALIALGSWVLRRKITPG